MTDLPAIKKVLDNAQEGQDVDPAEEVVFDKLDQLAQHDTYGVGAWTASQAAVAALRDAGLLSVEGSALSDPGTKGSLGSPPLTREELTHVADALARYDMCSLCKDIMAKLRRWLAAGETEHVEIRNIARAELEEWLLSLEFETLVAKMDLVGLRREIRRVCAGKTGRDR